MVSHPLPTQRSQVHPLPEPSEHTQDPFWGSWTQGALNLGTQQLSLRTQVRCLVAKEGWSALEGNLPILSPMSPLLS